MNGRRVVTQEGNIWFLVVLSGPGTSSNHLSAPKVALDGQDICTTQNVIPPAPSPVAKMQGFLRHALKDRHVVDRLQTTGNCFAGHHRLTVNDRIHQLQSKGYIAIRILPISDFYQTHVGPSSEIHNIESRRGTIERSKTHVSDKLSMEIKSQCYFLSAHRRVVTQTPDGIPKGTSKALDKAIALNSWLGTSTE